MMGQDVDKFSSETPVKARCRATIQPVEKTSSQAAVATEPFGFFRFTNEHVCILCWREQPPQKKAHSTERQIQL